MHVLNYTFTASFGILVVLALLSPFELLTSLCALLLLYFPGIYFTSFLKKEFDLTEILFLPLFTGISFWVVFSYFGSDIEILCWPTVVVVSFICAVLTDRRNIRITKDYQEVIFLLFCFLFVLSYSYPWSHFYSWMPPGDDMKFHLPIMERIVTEHSLPETYGPLYPEVTTLTYPLGYHAVVSLALFRFSLSSVTFLTLLIVSFSCFSFYFLGKTLFSKRVGLYSAFSFSFLSLFFHRLSATATYPNLVAISLQVVALFFLVEAFGKSFHALWLSALACAASGMTHPYTFLLNVLIFSLLFIYFLIMRDSSKMRVLFLVGAGFLFLCIPYFLRLEFGPLSDIEMRTFTAWYANDSIRSLHDLVESLSALNPFLLSFGLLGMFTLKEREKIGFVTVLISATLVIPLLSFFQIRYPGWYTLSPNRFLLYLFIPLSILSGKFIADLDITRRRFLGFMIIMVLLSVGIHHFNLFNPFVEDPVFEVQMNPEDAFIMKWISENTPEDAIILNTGSSMDCSSWVPVLCKRRVVFPFFAAYRGDHCIPKLKPYEPLIDFKIMENTPDSELALQTLSKYHVNYIYIPSWRKGSFLDLYPERLGSPLYTLMMRRGNACIFKVNYEKKPRTTFFTVVDGRDRLKDCFQVFLTPQLSPDAQGRFFLFISYIDESYEAIDIYENSVYKETLYRYKTGGEKSCILPLSGEEWVSVSLCARGDPVKWKILFGVKDVTKISEDIGLKGDWITEEEGFTAPKEESSLRVYVFNVDGGELLLRYKDTGHGNVDFNVNEAERWYMVKTLYRENTGEIREVRIPVNGRYTVFVIGMYVYGEDFTFYEIQYIP